jgi:hypothetical protein
MKRILSILLVLSLLLPCVAFADEAAREEITLTDQSDPSRQLTFSYPVSYGVYDEEDYYAGIFINSNDYVCVSLLPSGTTYLDDYADRLSSLDGLTTLADHLYISSVHDTTFNYEIVEVGISLDNGYDIVVFSLCTPGTTAIYDLLLDILGYNFIDTELVENWLNEVWYPQVYALAEESN